MFQLMQCQSKLVIEVVSHQVGSLSLIIIMINRHKPLSPSFISIIHYYLNHEDQVQQNLLQDNHLHHLRLCRNEKRVLPPAMHGLKLHTAWWIVLVTSCDGTKVVESVSLQIFGIPSSSNDSRTVGDPTLWLDRGQTWCSPSVKL